MHGLNFEVSQSHKHSPSEKSQRSFKSRKWERDHSRGVLEGLYLKHRTIFFFFFFHRLVSPHVLNHCRVLILIFGRIWSNLLTWFFTCVFFTLSAVPCFCVLQWSMCPKSEKGYKTIDSKNQIEYSKVICPFLQLFYFYLSLLKK